MLPAKLSQALRLPEMLTIAVSGGVDSLTLSAAAAIAREGQNVLMCHALSPAVPKSATVRVRELSETIGLPLKVVDAGEMADPNYRNNPVNRCYFCKSNLYKRLSQLGVSVAAGTNTDDLSDYRPGLQAADEYGVLHPFLSAEMSKSDVRTLARKLGLGDLAELPAAPCLASRIETALSVEPEDLLFIDQTESRFRERFGSITVRCRKLREGWVIELDEKVLERLDAQVRLDLMESVELAEGQMVSLRPYKRGSAFVHG